MTYEEFKSEFDSQVATIEWVLGGGKLQGFGAINHSLAACEAASEITGADLTFCKMFNRQFRDDAARMMLAA